MLYGEGAPGPHAVTTATNVSGTHTFTYDANGNMLQEYVNGSTLIHEYQYDADGLTSYRSSPGEGAYNYLYDPDGNLEWKKVPGQNYGTFYIGEVYEEDLDTGTVTKYYYAAGQRIAMRKNATLYYLTQDHLGGTALVTDASGQRIWKAHGLQPYRVRTFPDGASAKLSRDPQFVQKLQDVVGLYVDPPKPVLSAAEGKAMAFSVDEKSQIQALDCTQPGLPMKRGRAGTMTPRRAGVCPHDYKRNGTTTAAMPVSGCQKERVIRCFLGMTARAHRAIGHLASLNSLAQRHRDKMNLMTSSAE